MSSGVDGESGGRKVKHDNSNKQKITDKIIFSLPFTVVMDIQDRECFARFMSTQATCACALTCCFTANPRQHCLTGRRSNLPTRKKIFDY